MKHSSFSPLSTKLEIICISSRGFSLLPLPLPLSLSSPRPFSSAFFSSLYTFPSPLFPFLPFLSAVLKARTDAPRELEFRAGRDS